MCVPPRFTFAMMRALLRLRGAPPGGGGESGGDVSTSGLDRFPLAVASALRSFSSFCAKLSSQHWSSVMGSMHSASFSNSEKTRAESWSQIGGILSGSTRPWSLGPSSSSSELSSSLLLPSELSLVLALSRRTFFLVRSGGCPRLRFSHSSSMRTATRKVVRPKRWCVAGLHWNHGESLGGGQFLGTKNSSPSLPCSSSGSS
mmetsp:Transcript_29333/g.73202  ORF Transcript_29333/g.73202 Transcript_29333/m.73202 type:complete len:202 (+) Transcript_29333:1528-2133(+)